MMTPAEHQLFRRRANQARRLGRDPLEFLDTCGHLLTGARVRDIRATAIHQVADRLENMSVGQIIRQYASTGTSALDAQAGMVAAIRDMARREAEPWQDTPQRGS